MNLSKFELEFLGLVNHIGDLAKSWVVRVSFLPLMYLSSIGLLKIQGHMDSFIEKFENRLTSWERMYLSKE